MFASNDMTRFLIIDDHPLFREALHSAVELAYPEAETVDAASLEDASGLLESDQNFDLALLDLNIPGVRGFEGLLHMRANFPRIPVVVVSGHDDSRIVREVMSCGAAGFIPKSVRKSDLANAIRTVMDGRVFLPAKYENAEQDADGEARQSLMQKLATLTPQQLRVLNMLRDGLLNKQIAYELQVGETTVKAHVSEILRKLNVVSRTQAVIEVSKLYGEDLLRADRQFESAAHH